MIDVEPVRIVTGEAARGGVSLAVVIPWVMVVVGVGLIAGVLAHSVWRWFAGLDEKEQAFLLLSLRLGVRRRERAVLRALGRAVDAAPVGLLLSESAFLRAVELMGRGEEGSAAQVAIGRLEGRVFGAA